MKNIYKRASFLLLAIVVFVCNIYATSVSDNNGSAFITKAEFDALKSSFQSQIDAYNVGIDSKIDAAIAAYLSGIKVDENPTDYYALIKSAYGGTNPVFYNSIWTTKSTNTPEIGINIVNRYYIPTNILPDTDYEIWYNNSDGTTAYTPTTAGAFMVKWGTRVVPNATKYYGTSSAYNFFETKDMVIPITSTVPGQLTWQPGTLTSYGSNIWTNTTYNPQEKLKGNTTVEVSEDGEGTAYIVHLTPAGNIVFREYASSVWPILKGTVYFHMYNDYYAKNLTNWKSYHNRDNGMSLTTAQTLAMSSFTDWGTVSNGTSVTDESTTQRCWGDLSVRLYKVTDGVDYSSHLWGKTSGMYPYCIFNTVAPTAVSDSYTLSATTFESSYYDNSLNKKIQTNNIPSNKVTYYKPTITPVSIALKDISSDILTSLMGEDVYLGGGIPIFKANSNAKLRIQVKFGTSGGSTINFAISDKQFVDGSNVGTDIKTVNGATSGTTYTYDIDSIKDTIYWLNVYNTTTGGTAYVDSFSVDKV